MNHSAVTASAIRAKLGNYTDPYLDQTLSQAKAIVDVSADSNQVTIELKFGFPVADYADELLPALQSFLEPDLGGARINLILKSDITAHAVQKTLKPIGNVQNVIAVASGKGGVGKSLFIWFVAQNQKEEKTNFIDLDESTQTSVTRLGAVVGDQRVRSFKILNEYNKLERETIVELFEGPLDIERAAFA